MQYNPAYERRQQAFVKHEMCPEALRHNDFDRVLAIFRNASKDLVTWVKLNYLGRARQKIRGRLQCAMALAGDIWSNTAQI